MENINKRIALIAVGAALITSFLIYFYLTSINGTGNTANTKLIYVAKENIPAKVVITDNMLTQVKVPVDITLPIGVTDKEEVLGRMTRERIVKGEPILVERLFDEKKTTMPYIIPKGKRAVTISVNEVSEVSTFMTPGDFVDVIATYEEKDKAMGGRSIYYPKYTKVILQNVEVLGIGRNMQEVNRPEGELPTSVTLAVTLLDAEKLVLTEESGTLRLVLRPAADDSITITPGIIRDDMMTPKSKIEF